MAATGDIRRQIKYEIERIYNADTTGLKSATNGIYHRILPSHITEADYPLVMYYVITSSPEYAFDHGTSPASEEILVMFKILSNPSNFVSTEAENILVLLLAVYDGVSMVLDGWTLREFTRPKENGVIGPDTEINPDTGKTIWYVDVKYRATCDKN